MSLDNLAILHAARGAGPRRPRPSNAPRHILRRHVARVLPALAEAEQLSFLKPQAETTSTGPSGWSWPARAPARWAGRPAGFSTARRWPSRRWPSALLARDREDPAAGRLSAVRQRLAALILASPEPGQGPTAARGSAGSPRRSKNSRRNWAGIGRPARDDPWVALEEVRRALPEDAVLVEIARFRVFNFRAKGTEKQWLPPRYVAWIISPSGRGEVLLIDLGPAGAIEAGVAAVRRAIQPGRRRSGPRRAGRRDRAAPVPQGAGGPGAPAAAASHRQGEMLGPQPRRRAMAGPLGRCRWTRTVTRSRTTPSSTSSAAATWPGPRAGHFRPGAGNGRPRLRPRPRRPAAARQLLRGPPPAHGADVARPVRRSARIGPPTCRHRRRGQGHHPGLHAYAKTEPIVYTDRWAGDGLQGIPAAPRRRPQHPRLLSQTSPSHGR